MKKIDNIDVNMSKLFEVNRHMPIPMGLSAVLYETFKCAVCLLNPIAPPLIIGKCCKRIIGCQRCIDRWYLSSTEDAAMKSCPLCHGDRGFADSMILLGIDELLITLKNLQLPPIPTATVSARHGSPTDHDSDADLF